MALTGTASKIVLKDVQRELEITAFDAIITPETFDRPELRYSILTCPSDEKAQQVQGFLGRLPTEFGLERSRFSTRRSASQAGLVFCPHVNGSFGVAEQAAQLSSVLATRVDVYSGDAPRGQPSAQWQDRKRRIALDFKQNRTTVLACTKAFGMGIDKPNIRYTVHLRLPASIEGFYQEAGRAGRDQKHAECAIVLSNGHPARSAHLLAPGTPLAEVAAVVEETSWSESDDVIRALYFHIRAFRGEEAELDDIAEMVDALGDVTVRRLVTVSWRNAVWQGKARYGCSKNQCKSPFRESSAPARAAWRRPGLHGEPCQRGVYRPFRGASREEITIAATHFATAFQRRLGDELHDEILALDEVDHRVFILELAGRLLSFIYDHVESVVSRPRSPQPPASMGLLRIS